MPRVQVAPGLMIYKRLSVEGPGTVSIGPNCVVDGIRGDSSQYVTIDTHHPGAVITIGANASLYAARISSKFMITIGDNVLVEESSIVDTDFHSIERRRKAPEHENVDACRISIGNNVLIGARSVVTKGVAIGENAIVTPGSVVFLPVKPDSVVAGNPAR